MIIFPFSNLPTSRLLLTNIIKQLVVFNFSYTGLVEEVNYYCFRIIGRCHQTIFSNNMLVTHDKTIFYCNYFPNSKASIDDSAGITVY